MLPDFRLETFFAQWEFHVAHHLTASDAETLGVSELLALAGPEDRHRWETLRLGYIESRGMPALRDGIAQTYERIKAEQILTFAGAEEGLYCAMRVLLSADDHAVVLVPNYQSMESIPSSICAVTGIALHPENNWELNLDEVKAALRPNTRVLAVNFPNNPTGKICGRQTFDQLIELCAQRGLYFFSDEVYRGIERDEAKRLPQAADLYERALSLNVVSKAYGLPGLRVGWIASQDATVLDRMEKYKYYLSICNAGPSEVLALIAINARETILGRNRALAAENLKKLDRFFARHTDLFQWYAPDGGCVAYPKYLGAEDVEDFCKRLAQDAGVLLVPASIYQSNLLAVPKDRLRIGYGRRGMDEALEAFEAGLVCAGGR